MAQSQAKKHRQKLIREGKRSPELSRSPFAFQDLRTRKTKTKQEQLHRQKYKNHASMYGDDGSYYFNPRNLCFSIRLKRSRTSYFPPTFWSGAA
ncbi:hypothetical protein NSQ80_05550 [Paenibacillus sp. FSL K6-2441]|uniref:hypothetical protein n=1 Tax=Paenibacillus sp. FSL K6-2441 TaxID=2954679 RepID=UPI0021A29103|nr:hypothetical protein [Paenibacillus sp. p3-SID1389]MCT2193831.1 hypothetical protein [Paenibacillus sp. p3-SID1389]